MSLRLIDLLVDLRDRYRTQHKRSFQPSYELEESLKWKSSQPELALSGNGADLNARSGRRDFPLIVATLSGHAEIVKLLIDYSAEVNADNLNVLRTSGKV
ncbi:MAG: hypothetical protein M1813_006341 [Trichoglossum hirsutum]|nr:MAG: hypothetical protein M1813_006341 [Trichoglossum hirsutum]